MNETTDRKKTEATDDRASNKIEAYLQGPRKKRKNYVVLALGEGFDRDTAFHLEAYIKKNYPQLAIATPKTPEELMRQFGRNISLLLINDVFADRKMVMNMVRSLKEKRREESIPVLFLTREAEPLVDLYHKELFLYHETDEYVVYPGLPRQQLLARVKSGIDNQNKRKSRRYLVNLPISFYHLNKDQILQGRIVDLSLHGAIISAEEHTIFRLGDQIKMNIVASDTIRSETGDFIKISGRIRRVFIAGNKAALSFEHVTQLQSHAIAKLILAIVSQNFSRQTSKLRSQTVTLNVSKR